MKLKLAVVIAAGCVLVCIGALAQATQINVEPAHVEVSEGHLFTVNITVYPEGNETYGAQYTLSFDNTLLNATDQTTGTFLSQGGGGTNVYTNKINNTLGKIKYSETRIGDDVGGVTGNGTLTTITFQAIAKHGTGELLFDKIKLSDANATYLTVHANNGNVEIVALCDDVNSDCEITPADAVIALQMAVHGEYESVVDVNHDDRVTSLDALMIQQAADGYITFRI